MRKKLDAKRTFRIHFVAFDGFELEEYLELFDACYPIKRKISQGLHTYTIEVRMRHSDLVRTISKLPPKLVTVAYEEA